MSARELAPHPVQAPSWGGRLVGVDGLRGLAALLVLTYHVGTVLAPSTVQRAVPFVGWFDRGLTLFFVLSGFLLFRPFAAALLDGRSPPPVRDYLRNRALRIWPAYVVVLLLVDGVLRVARLPGVVPLDRSVPVGGLEPGTLLADLLLVQTFAPGSLRTGLEVAWTLTVEVTFYAVLPLLVLLAVRVGRGRHRLLAVAVPPLVLLAIGLTTRVVVAFQTVGLSRTEAWRFRWGDEWSAVLCRSLLAQADLFAIGMGAAVLLLLVERGRVRLDRLRLRLRLRLRPWVWAAAGLGCLLGVLLPAVIGDDVFALACAALLVAVVSPTAADGPGRVARLLDARPIRAAGVVSFSVYLWHLAVIRWLQEHRLVAADTAGGLLANLSIVLVVTGAFAAATYLAVERPAQRFRRRPFRAPVRDAGSGV